MYRKFTPPLPSLLFVACAGVQQPTAGVRVPDKLMPPSNESLAMIVRAKGVQIYECRAKKDLAGGYEWAFVAPEADLFDVRGNRLGKHYAGPRWESSDGSKEGCAQSAVGTMARIYYTADYYFFTVK